MNIHHCHRCPHRQQACVGKCPCTIDGRDIIDHATAGDCPKGFFTGPEKMPPRSAKPDIPLAGDVVEKIAKAVGADRLAKFWEKWTGQPCGCPERKAKLNRATERLLKWLASQSARSP